MRLVLLLLVSAATVFAGGNVQDRLSSKYKYLPQAAFTLYQRKVERMKRDIRVHRLKDPDSCIRNCSNSMNQGLQSVNETDSEEVAAKQLCSATAAVETCYKTCPESQFKNLMLYLLPTMKVPCLLGPDKYSEMEKILACLNNTDTAISEKCDSVCNSTLDEDVRMESRILVNVNPPFIMYDDDKQENTQMLQSTCRYLSCQQQCGDPIAKEKCGQMAVDLDHKITTSVFGSVIKLYQEMNALAADIPECKSVM